MANAKRRWGDRVDGALVRDGDPLHFIMPYLYPNRADNEAFIREEVDLTAVEEYLKRKNEGLSRAERYTLMHVICAALVRTITLRPKMNRFVKGRRVYQRDKVSLAFVVKKQFADEGKEALAFRSFGPETTLDSLHEEIMAEIRDCRSDKPDHSTDAMSLFTKLPRWLMRIVMRVIFALDEYGKVPQALIKTDPNYATVLISNLGSIGLNAAYHHLSNWGTCSIFLVIGKKHVAPVFHEDGSFDMRTVVGLGVTLDERIADGYYYARSIDLMKHLLQHPELLEQPSNREVAL